MMNETFDLIQKLATERTNLYRLAGKQHLSGEQLSRIHEIEGRLVTLWDLHRRELAGARRPVRYSEALRAA
jgi:Mg2+ and Co2+ transporter CorA